PLASYKYWQCDPLARTSASIRNYLRDLHYFILWYETEREAHVHDCFASRGITTPKIRPGPLFKDRNRIWYQVVEAIA
ncbi:MAG: hypothetical protein M3Z24_15880, partial [Chloroflexota bacterium]|nr:hypothetical protein [Chloroflexota bacterium]